MYHPGSWVEDVLALQERLVVRLDMSAGELSMADAAATQLRRSQERRALRCCQPVVSMRHMLDVATARLYAAIAEEIERPAAPAGSDGSTGGRCAVAQKFAEFLVKAQDTGGTVENEMGQPYMMPITLNSAEGDVVDAIEGVQVLTASNVSDGGDGGDAAVLDGADQDSDMADGGVAEQVDDDGILGYADVDMALEDGDYPSSEDERSAALRRHAWMEPPPADTHPSIMAWRFNEAVAWRDFDGQYARDLPEWTLTHQWRAMGWTKGSQLFGPKCVPLGERVVKLFTWYPHIQMTGVDLGYHSTEAPNFVKFTPDTFSTFASSNKESPHFSLLLSQVHLRLCTTRQKDVAGWKAGNRASAPPDPNERYIFVHDLMMWWNQSCGWCATPDCPYSEQTNVDLPRVAQRGLHWNAPYTSGCAWTMERINHQLPHYASNIAGVICRICNTRRWHTLNKEAHRNLGR